MNNLVYKGIDLSHHQKAGSVNFKRLKDAGYEFVILRAGYGKHLSQKDKAFESHYRAAKDAGLKIGAYHYSYATSVSDAKKEAKCFLQWIADKKLEYPVAFDIEDACQKKLTTQERTDIALTFMQIVEDAGYYTMLYSSANWLGGKLDMERLKHFDVWCAAYVGNASNIKKYYQGSYGIWQHTSNKYVLQAYKGRLDENYAYKDYAKIIRNAKLNNL